MNIHKVYAFLGVHFRRRRMEVFSSFFSPTATTRVVDLGGAPETWIGHDTKLRLTLVNLDTNCLKGHIPSVVADALACPFEDKNFDVVFSNSLIEHLSSEENQRAFAAEVQRLSRNGYFVQTPNRWFPIEPHFLGLFVQFVPKRFRPGVVRWMTLWGWIAKPSRELCQRCCNEIRLVDARELQLLFPDATIVRERFLGLTKSLIAVRTQTVDSALQAPNGTR